MGVPLTEEQRQCWKEKIQAQKSSGLSVDKWCQENNVVACRFHYWKKKLFSKLQPVPLGFVELKDPSQCKLSLHYQGVSLQLESTNLKEALRILEKLACS